MGKKLAVIFPGVGYTTDRPLLYYAKKIAKQNGFEILELHYSGFKTDVALTRETMLSGFGLAVQQTEEQLKNVRFQEYEELIFVSKSIGTVGAAVYAARHQLKVRQVFFTPLEQTFSLIQKENGLVFHGDSDPWADVEKIRQLCREMGIARREIKNGNHSLETGSIQKDVSNMATIVQEMEDYLVGSPIYRFRVQNQTGGETELSEYKGKVLLIANTATGCGFTPQYKALEEMYRKYREKGFEILDFPCDQFHHQAPGSDDEIHRFCTSMYQISFPQFSKILVNGEGQSPLFAYLKEQKGFGGFLRNSPDSHYIERQAELADKNYQNSSDIKWNFTKFLINRYGQVIERFEPDAGTAIVEQAIARVL